MYFTTKFLETLIYPLTTKEKYDRSEKKEKVRIFNSRRRHKVQILIKKSNF